jgi:hypothetical protein
MHRRRSFAAPLAATLVAALLAMIPGSPIALASAKSAAAHPVEHTETADISANSDGSRTAVFYASPVNFFDKTTKEWRKLDKAFRQVGDHIENGAGPSRVQLPGRLAANAPITIEKDDWSASLTFPAASSNRPAKIAKGHVRYDDVTAAGVSLDYRMLSNGIKENIDLDAPPAAGAPAQFRFELAVTGATPVAVDGGTAVALQDGAGQELARIPRGTMADANGATGVVDMHLTQDHGVWFVDVVPDSGFLHAAGRAYPVQIDPSVIYSPTSPTDSFTDSVCTTCNYNGLDFLKAGWMGSAQYYSYLRFPDLTAIVGKGVTNAQLRVEATYESDPSNYGLLALRTHGSWNASTITWANMAAHGPEQYRINKGVQGGPAYYFDITSWAQGWAAGQDGEWINGKWSPYGATINTGGNAAYYQLGAAESTFVPDIPSMSVTYTDQSPNVPPSLYPPDGWVGTSAPPLIAGFSDNDDTTGSINFEIAGVTTSTQPVGAVSSGEGYYTPTLAPGTYSWRAQGVDANSAGGWTPYRTFTINSPVVFSDDFTGTNGTGWNTTKWATTTNDAAKVANIQSNQGELSVVTSSARASAKMTAMQNADATLTYKFNDRTLRSFLRIMMRASGATGAGQMPTGYRLELRTDTGTIKLQSCVSSTCTLLTSFSYIMDTNPQNLRFQTVGNLVRVKVWPVGTSEPSTWQIDLPDNSILGAGVLQINHNFDTGAHSVDVDNVVIRVKSPEENEKDFDDTERSDPGSCAYAIRDADHTVEGKYGRACAQQDLLKMRGGFGGASGKWKPGPFEVCKKADNGNCTPVDSNAYLGYSYTHDYGPYGLPYLINGARYYLAKGDKVICEWVWDYENGVVETYSATMVY